MDGVESLDFAMKYPFTSVAKKILEEKAVSLTDRLVQLGFERIRKAINERLAKSISFNEEQKFEELASYAAARMILGHLRNRYLTNKFAVEESKRVHAYLNTESPDVVEKVAGELRVTTREEQGKILTDIPVFLCYAPKSVHYRLINREIINGTVAITKEERKRLVEEAVRKKMSEIPLVKNPPDSIKNAGKKLLDYLPKPKVIAVNAKPGDHPPCVEKLLESIRKHENLPHTARWFLATYLIGIGMSDDQIMGMYSNLPDFSEKITRYQIEHARKKGYSVPSCATLTTYGLCCANCRIGTPINWHTRDKKGGKHG